MTDLLDLFKMASIGKPYTISKSVIHYPVPGMTKEYAIKVWKQQKKRGVTNSLFVKDVEKYNKVYVINGHLKITKVLKDDEDGKVIFEKLKKLSPKLLLKKEIDELKNSDKNGFRANSLFIQIDATDLLNNI